MIVIRTPGQILHSRLSSVLSLHVGLARYVQRCTVIKITLHRASSHLATVETRGGYGSRVDLGVAVACGVALIVGSGVAELCALGEPCAVGDPCGLADPLGEA